MADSFIKKDPKSNNYSSPEEKKTSEDIAKIVSKRTNVFTFVIISLMLVLLYRLFDMQVLNSESYQTKLVNYTSRYRKITTPRGEIYDRNGNVLVTNRQVVEIVYYPPSDTSKSEKWEVAKKFAKTFNVTGESLTKRDLKDLYIFLYPDLATNKITEEEWNKYHDSILKDNDIYNLKLDRITDSDLDTLKDEEKNGWLVYYLMNNASVSQTTVIKEDVTFEEVSYFIEHIEDFRGFDVTIDWAREYPYNSTLRNILGSVTTSKSGLPAEKLQYYLALDYSRNEKVGKSGIELQYESLLSGERSTYNVSYNEEGLAQLENVTEGKKGYDLLLSIDIDLQSKIEEIIIDFFEREKDNVYRKYWDTCYCVAMNPKNGDILALAGVKKTDDGYFLDPVSTYTESVIVGSAVKGATVYMGLDTGVIKIGEKIHDEPIKIKDTPIKKSSQANLGWLDEVHALSQSSNVFMFNVAMRIGKANYHYDEALNIDPQAFDTMRNYYSQFGLGVKTGIDLPNETTGYAGTSTIAGNLLDYAIGQYSTYTPMQLAQYISAIANNGYLIRPHVVKEAYESGTEYVVYQNNTDVISTLDNKAAIERVQKGFRTCVVDGLCKAYLSTLNVSVAAKTGTAENTVDGLGEIQSPNNTLIAYAPYEDPEIVLAISAVNSWNDKSQLNICQKIGYEIFKYYFDE